MNLPFELQIADIDTAETLVEQCWPTKIVTLLGPYIPPKKDIASTGDHHLRIVMDGGTISMPGWIAPKAHHIQTILDFTHAFTQNDRVLIHCRDGISRSTSTSIGVLVQHGMPAQKAIEAVLSLRACADPNELVIHLMDHALNQRMQLIDAYQSWAACHPHTLINRMPETWRKEIDDNAREFYRTWDLHSSARKGAQWRS